MSVPPEELRRRVPRLIVNTVILIILYFLYPAVPLPFRGIEVPGLNIYGDQLMRLTIMLLIGIFLAKALPDALYLMDVGVDMLLTRLDIKKKEKPLKRAARDLLYIILVILLAAATLPFFSAIPSEVGGWLSAATSLVTLALVLILLYDIGRIFYSVLEKKTEALTLWLKGGEEREDDNKE